MGHPSPSSALPPRKSVLRSTSIDFAKNQLYSSLIGLSPLGAPLRRLLPQTCVGSSSWYSPAFNLEAPSSLDFGSVQRDNGQVLDTDPKSVQQYVGPFGVGRDGSKRLRDRKQFANRDSSEVRQTWRDPMSRVPEGNFGESFAVLTSPTAIWRARCLKPSLQSRVGLPKIRDPKYEPAHIALFWASHIFWYVRRRGMYLVGAGSQLPQPRGQASLRVAPDPSLGPGTTSVLLCLVAFSPRAKSSASSIVHLCGNCLLTSTALRNYLRLRVTA